ncbi:MAG: AtpZ/AtpI family protein [Planctomycetota bacterium]|nr:MAG: AtpZ/AtpI family protein [Planctomycetota bacterium]
MVDSPFRMLPLGAWLPARPVTCAVAQGSALIGPVGLWSQALPPEPRGGNLESSQSDQAQNSQDQDSRPAHATNGHWQGLHVGYVLAASVMIGLGIGYGIDVWLDSLPWGMVGGALFFIAAGLYQVVKEFLR